MPMDTYKFEQMLTHALQKHCESVPADFTSRTLQQIRQAQQQKMLASVILQERFALAGCIILSTAAIITAIIFPDIAAALRHTIMNMTQQVETFIDKTPQAIQNLSNGWQNYCLIAISLAFAVYSLVELFIESTRA